MFWALLALLGAFCNAAYFAGVKKFLHNVNQYVLISGVLLSSSIMLLLISLFRGIPILGEGFYTAVLCTASLNFLAILLYLKALQKIDLSLAMPMLSFTPVFLVLTSFLLLNEVPTLGGLIGIILIVAGAYILNLNKNGFLSPFKELFKNRYMGYMLLVAFIYSLSSNFDKMVVTSSDAFFGSGVIYMITGIAFFIIALVKTNNTLREYWRSGNKLILLGAITVGEAAAVNTALSLQIVPYVISLKRVSILFSVFFGGMLFHEKKMLQRSIGALIMVSGVACILLL